MTRSPLDAARITVCRELVAGAFDAGVQAGLWQMSDAQQSRRREEWQAQVEGALAALEQPDNAGVRELDRLVREMGK